MKKKNLKAFCLLLFILVCSPLLFVGCTENEKQLNFYKIDATFDEQKMSLNCSQSVRYVNESDNILNEICFFIYANAFDEEQKTVSNAYYDKAYPNGKSAGAIEFSSITTAGEKAEYSISDKKEILTVSLKDDLFPDEAVVIDMQYIVLLANINHRLGYGENTINFGNFFPIACVYEDGFVKNSFTANGDPFYSDISNFEVNLKCPEKYVVASTGDKSESVEGGMKTVSCKAEKVRDFCFVLSEKFDVLTQKVGETTVYYYCYDDEDSQQFLQTSVDALKTFQTLFAEYPYKQLSVVKTNFCFGGMEYPNLVMISDAITDVETYNYVIVHEIAHQWWYGMVGNNQYSDSWVDEGLTEFSTALFFEKNPNYKIDYDTIMQNAAQTYSKFVEVFEKINGEVDESMDRNLSEFATEPEYVCIAYTKGMLLFDALRESMSEQRFMKCLGDYFERFKFENSSPEKLIDSFSKSSHFRLKNFFESWINGEVEIG